MHAESLEALENLARQLATAETERRVAGDFAHGLQQLVGIAQIGDSPQRAATSQQISDGKENCAPRPNCTSKVQEKTPEAAVIGGPHQVLQERSSLRTESTSCSHREELESRGSQRETSNSSFADPSGHNDISATLTLTDEELDEELACVARCSGRVRATQARLRESSRKMDEQLQLAEERLSAAVSEAGQPRQSGTLQARLSELRHADAKLTAQLQALQEEEEQSCQVSPGSPASWESSICIGQERLEKLRELLAQEDLRLEEIQCQKELQTKELSALQAAAEGSAVADLEKLSAMLQEALAQEPKLQTDLRKFISAADQRCARLNAKLRLKAQWTSRLRKECRNFAKQGGMAEHSAPGSPSTDICHSEAIQILSKAVPTLHESLPKAQDLDAWAWAALAAARSLKEDLQELLKELCDSETLLPMGTGSARELLIRIGDLVQKTLQTRQHGVTVEAELSLEESLTRGGKSEEANLQEKHFGNPVEAAETSIEAEKACQSCLQSSGMLCAERSKETHATKTGVRLLAAQARSSSLEQRNRKPALQEQLSCWLRPHETLGEAIEDTTGYPSSLASSPARPSLLSSLPWTEEADARVGVRRDAVMSTEPCNFKADLLQIPQQLPNMVTHGEAKMGMPEENHSLRRTTARGEPRAMARLPSPPRGMERLGDVMSGMARTQSEPLLAASPTEPEPSRQRYCQPLDPLTLLHEGHHLDPLTLLHEGQHLEMLLLQHTGAMAGPSKSLQEMLSPSRARHEGVQQASRNAPSAQVPERKASRRTQAQQADHECMLPATSKDGQLLHLYQASRNPHVSLATGLPEKQRQSLSHSYEDTHRTRYNKPLQRSDQHGQLQTHMEQMQNNAQACQALHITPTSNNQGLWTTQGQTDLQQRHSDPKGNSPSTCLQRARNRLFELRQGIQSPETS